MPVELSVLCPVLVGRIDSLEQATRLIEQVRHGSAQTLLITGEAGSGKSRLVAEIKARALVAGFGVVQGHCFEADRALPYAPLLDLLRTFCLSHSGAAIEAALGRAAGELVKLLPELTALLPGLMPTPTLEPDAEKLRLFQALAQFFGGQTEAGPLLILIEDLHWSDETSLDFLYHVARRRADWPWLLVLTCRSEEESAGLKALLARLEHDRLAEEVLLAPLSRAEVNSMLEAIFRLGQPVRPEFLDVIYGLTEGNPFFVEEVLKSLLATGDIYYADGRWERKPVNELRVPRTVQVAVQRRTDLLSPAAHQLLTLAAVAGRRIDFTLLQHVMQRLEPTLSESALLNLIKELRAAQLVIETGSDSFAFRHALTRAAILGDLLARERRPLHHHVAEALEQLYAGSVEPHLARLADHFYEAGDWPKAMTYAWRAGERAQALGAPQAALGHFSRAVMAAEHGASTPLPGLYLARGAAYEVTGGFEAARADYEHALALSRSAQDRRAEWQALLALGFLWAARDYQRAGGYLQAALQQARDLDDPTSLAHSLNRIGNWHLNMEQPVEAVRQHREALALFEARADPRGIAETLDLLGTTTITLADFVQGRAYYRRAAELLRVLNDRAGLAACLSMLALCGPQYLSNTAVWSNDRPGEAEGAGREALQLLQEIGWRSGEALAQINLGLCLAGLGEYGSGLAAMAAGLKLAHEVEHHYWKTLAHLALGAAYVDLLVFDAAEAHLQQALMLARVAGSDYWIRTVLGFLVPVHLARGELEAGHTLLEGSVMADRPAQTMGERQTWAAQAELWLAQKSPEAALALVERLIVTAPNRRAEDYHAIPRLARLRAQSLLALNRVDEAAAALSGARDAARAYGAQPILWRLEADLGRLYRLRRQPEQADTELEAAHTLIAELAARLPDEPLPEVTRALLGASAATGASMRESFRQAAHAHVPERLAQSARQRAQREFDGLTAREREVAMLVAQGRSNRAMADALVVSERTIEKHVENILSKLGFTSRSQIAAWAVAKGLAEH